jgi:hypothetical protein
MAKGQRASTVKRNNTALRAKFAPIYDARTARLSAKLQQIAAQPKPSRDETMDADAEGLKVGQNSDSDSDVNMNGVSKSKTKKSVSGSTKRRGPTRVMKKIANRKAKKSIMFERSAGKKKRLANDMAKKKS